jgi:peptidoglycan/xylan/chitin deacetylase (PgdA/CDA1 family)
MIYPMHPFKARYVVRTGIAALVLSAAAPASAMAADCPGNPNALGTSRTLVVDPIEHPRVGTMQYPETLPLQDHEVVLTFDDGPLPKHTKPVLDLLASQCVKATFFIVGEMATSFPDTLRATRAAGHTIGTHTQTHPLRMQKMTIEANKAEIDQGIASSATVLGDASQVAPFLRIPGLLRSSEVEDYLASKGIMTWSADFLADDWHRISSSRVAELAIKRLEAHGRGILLLHDIHERTQMALPTILHEMKVRGYRIVHVVPATAELPKTPTEAWQWHLHPVDPALVAQASNKTRGDMRFAFDLPAPLSEASVHNAATDIPAAARLSSAGTDSAPIWRVTGPLRTDDVASRLLAPAPDTFEFSETAPRALGAKAAPQE